MTVAVVCSSCRAKLNVPDQFIGKKVKCPKCKSPVAVSDPGEAEGVEAVAVPPPAGKTKPSPAVRPAAAKASAVKPSAAKPAPKPVVNDDEDATDDDDEGSEPEKPAKKKSILPLILIGVGLLAVAGVVVLGAGVVVILYLQMSPIAPANPGGGQGAVTPIRIGDNVNWVEHENAEHHFKASFPNAAPAPFDPLAEITDPTERDLAAAMMKDRKMLYLAATDGDRRYLLAAGALQLGPTPVRTYLSRMEGGLPRIHKGFKIEPGVDAESAGHPARDYTLRQEAKAKLIRYVVAPGWIYTLTVEGGPDLNSGDPKAKGFFDKFASTLPPAAGGTKPTTPSQPNTPTSTDPGWVAFRSEKAGYQLSFPAQPAPAQDALEAILDPAQRKKAAALWATQQASYESYAATFNGRRFIVTAFYDGKDTGVNAFNNQNNRSRQYILDVYAPQRTQAAKVGDIDGMYIATSLVVPKAGGRVKVREARAGKYSFLLRVEGDKDMDENDPVIGKFLNSLKPPEGALPK